VSVVCPTAASAAGGFAAELPAGKEISIDSCNRAATVMQYSAGDQQLTRAALASRRQLNANKLHF